VLGFTNEEAEDYYDEVENGGIALFIEGLADNNSKVLDCQDVTNQMSANYMGSLV